MENPEMNDPDSGNQPPSATDRVEEPVAVVRRFNRFYTKQIGVLRQGLSDTRFTLSEARVLYELARGGITSASGLSEHLGMDPGFVSRILKRFAKAGLLQRDQSRHDGRKFDLALTGEGKEAFRDLNMRAEVDVSTMLETLRQEDRNSLVSAMHAIEQILEPDSDKPSPWIIHEHQPGDIGYAIYRHGILYAEEFGWGSGFEALVADVLGRFVASYDPTREQSWIAERYGRFAGCVFIADAGENIAQLRCLLVEPCVRGQGLGGILVDECIRFSRQKGYDRIILWTNSVLLAARRLYESRGFVLIKEESHHSFGHDLVGETWELLLQQVES
jgi:DNA-binding MarR family transcriptional regulator/N-acetylglutamate synthase-like GNAT family acetyltransferase